MTNSPREEIKKTKPAETSFPERLIVLKQELAEIPAKLSEYEKKLRTDAFDKCRRTFEEVK